MNLIVAQAVTAAGEINPFTAIFAYGPMGVMLGWFMLIVTKDLRTLNHRIDGLTRAMLMDVISRNDAGSIARKFAEEALAKVEARSNR